jgi:uncharacterized ParB-like nuclease family protein
MMVYTLTDEQLNVLIEQKVENLLAVMGHIPTHITARAAWKICGSRARFEYLCDIGQIKPVDVVGYKAKRYLRSDVMRAAKGVKTSNKRTQKIRL